MESNKQTFILFICFVILIIKVCYGQDELETFLNISKIELTEQDKSVLEKIVKIRGKEKRKKMVDRYLDIQLGIPRVEDIIEAINATSVNGSENSESSESDYP